MSELREAAQLALDALHRWHWAKETTGLDAAHDALRDALLEPEQIVPSDCSDSHQPVAWMRLIDASQEARLNSVINAYGESDDISYEDPIGDNNREDMEARRCAAAIRARGNT
jgi:hypothetical protein